MATTQATVGVIKDGSISTAKIANDAVTLAKMAPAVDGSIISYDASQNPVLIAPGNDGQVLTSAGAGAQPAFENAAGGGLQSIQVFTSSGTWTKPGGISSIEVITTAAGGGGGGSFEDSFPGGGGGAGATAIEIIDVSSIDSETVTVGVAGVAGGSNGNGAQGGTSSFGSHNSCTGGFGGSSGGNSDGSSSNRSAGGVATGGDVNIIGGDGVVKQSGSGTKVAGLGGGSYFGTGGRSAFRGLHATVYPGRAYGSGGGGGDNDSTTSPDGSSGGAGAGGIIIVREYA